MKITDEFENNFQSQAEAEGFTPYRICPLGAHVDHNLGIVTGMAINKGIRIAYRAEPDGTVEVHSLQFDTPARWNICRLPEKQNDWADYLRGAAKALQTKAVLTVGLRAVIGGELPIGGLSSSAAVTISFLNALCRVNGITLTERELIDLSRQAETDFVGVSCGKLDQSCEVLCRKNHLLYMDFRDDSFENILQSADMKEYEIAVFFSGLERCLISGKYNMRVDELKSAAYALMAYSGMEYGKYSEAFMRDVPEEVFYAYKDRLPPPFRKRAEHFYGECERVRKGIAAWRQGDLDRFGSLCFESGQSSIENWQTGSPELSKLYEILRQTDGVYGGRFSGAGFKGCCIAFIDPKKQDEILYNVKKHYTRSFPELQNKYCHFICHSADGVSASHAE